MIDRRGKSIQVVAAAFIVVGAASARAGETGVKDGALRAFLQQYLKGPAEDRTTRYSVARVSLNDKTQMDPVYISGDLWCGSGGCTALLLEGNHSSFKVVQEFSLARLPIRLLPSRTNGWHDLAMPVSGGGASPHRAVLHYDGARYPSNPSMAPVSRSAENSGTELPLQETGDLFYP